jgi:DNA-binding GntR family transcriptional regulator
MAELQGGTGRMTSLVPAIEELVSTLRRQILSGDAGPGTPLNQNELATRFRLNRSQVREALTALAEERLVRMRPYATAVVAPFSLDEFQELHEIRIALEPMLSRLALPAVTRQHVLQMRRLIETMAETTDGATWLDSNDEFHGVLFRLANRPWLVEIVDRARRLNSRYNRVLVFEMENRHGEQDHRQILEAIENQDSKALETRLTTHIKSGHDLVLQHLVEHTELLDVGVHNGASATH